MASLSKSNTPIDISSFTNLSEEEVVATIDKIAKRLAGRFKFGYHEIQDIEQQARLLAWEGMAKYDGIRPLENYLWVHVRNRLFNFKRDNFFRPYGPCEKCKLYSKNKCVEYDDKEKCELYQQWKAKNITKINLIYPIEFSCVDDQNENNMSDDILTENCVSNNELQSVLNRYMPVEYRHYYLRLIYGYHVAPQYKIPLLSLIQEILQKHYFQTEDSKEDNKEDGV